MKDHNEERIRWWVELTYPASLPSSPGTDLQITDEKGESKVLFKETMLKVFDSDDLKDSHEYLDRLFFRWLCRRHPEAYAAAKRTFLNPAGQGMDELDAHPGADGAASGDDRREYLFAKAAFDNVLAKTVEEGVWLSVLRARRFSSKAEAGYTERTEKTDAKDSEIAAHYHERLDNGATKAEARRHTIWAKEISESRLRQALGHKRRLRKSP